MLSHSQVTIMYILSHLVSTPRQMLFWTIFHKILNIKPAHLSVRSKSVGVPQKDLHLLTSSFILLQGHTPFTHAPTPLQPALTTDSLRVTEKHNKPLYWILAGLEFLISKYDLVSQKTSPRLDVWMVHYIHFNVKLFELTHNEKCCINNIAFMPRVKWSHKRFQSLLYY